GVAPKFENPDTRNCGTPKSRALVTPLFRPMVEGLKFWSSGKKVSKNLFHPPRNSISNRGDLTQLYDKDNTCTVVGVRVLYPGVARQQVRNHRIDHATRASKSGDIASGGHINAQRGAAMLALPFVGKEKECFVFEDRPAQRAPELIVVE